MPARQTSRTYESYTVQKGDTVSAIAKRFGTTVAAIQATSGLADPNKIKVGQVLSIAVESGYNPADLELSEVQVPDSVRTLRSSSEDPVAALVNAAAEWLKPPRLWVTLGLGFGAAYYLLSSPRPRRRRR